MDLNIQQVADGVHFVEGSHTNFALVVEGEAVTVIDTGYPRDRRRVLAAIESIGRTPSDCDALLITHCHVDHTGCAEWLRTEAVLDVHCHADEEFQVTGGIKQQISPGALLTRLFKPNVASFTMNAVLAGGLYRRPVRAVSTFGDGDTLDVPGAPVAVHTPGHTSGHASFHLPGRGVLVAGDALCNVNLWDPTDIAPQMVPPPFVHDWDESVRSLDRLAGLEASVVIPGHGEPWRGSPAEAVELAKRRLD
ncbi:MAG: MBL fold metallo-hydrolase [Nitriliruptorales bacterium]|nr:MBL fold metallo-hydrolase [Nitriliruptorales bacterium]